MSEKSDTTIGVSKEVALILKALKPDGVSWNYFFRELLKKAGY